MTGSAGWHVNLVEFKKLKKKVEFNWQRLNLLDLAHTHAFAVGFLFQEDNELIVLMIILAYIDINIGRL